VAFWDSGLTKDQINDLEKIQKIALKIILSDSYRSFDMACKFFNVKSLKYGRLDLCTYFVLKLYKSDRSSDFTLPDKLVNTRSDPLPVVENKVNTVRFFNAPQNYLARLVNLNLNKLKTKTQKQKYVGSSCIPAYKTQTVTCGLLGHCPVVTAQLNLNWS
jgi:hypothetical protein